MSLDDQKESKGFQYLKIKVVGQDNNEVHFRVKTTSMLAKMKKAYSERIGIPLTTLRFIFEGRRLDDTDTPASLDMEEGDKVEVFQEQTGGF